MHIELKDFYVYFFRAHLMQADSSSVCHAWITAIQNSVKQAYADSSLNNVTQVSFYSLVNSLEMDIHYLMFFLV